MSESESEESGHRFIVFRSDVGTTYERYFTVVTSGQRMHVISML